MRQPLYLCAVTVAVLLLIVLLVPISAWLRHADVPPPALLAAEPGALGALMRDAHRLIASTLLMLVLVINGVAWLGGGSCRSLRKPAVVLLAITLALALLGISAGSSRHAAVVMGHLFGGLFAAVTAMWLVLVAIAPNNKGAKPLLSAPAAVAWTAAITTVLGGYAGAVGWPPAMILHVIGTIVLVVLLGYGLMRTGGTGWLALLLVAAAGATGWWAAQEGMAAVAATSHTAMAMLLLLELIRLLFHARANGNPRHHSASHAGPSAS